MEKRDAAAEAKRVADEKAAVKQAAQEAKRKYEKEAAAARLAALKPQVHLNKCAY